MRTEERSGVRTAVGVATLVLAVATAAGPAAAQADRSADPGKPVGRSYVLPPGALLAPGETPTITLLYTGNVVGYIDPCG